MKQRKHLFSNIETADLFTIQVTGRSILQGQVHFTIVTNKGKQLFRQSFSALDLLGDINISSIGVKAKEDTIKKRVNDFFKEEHFFKPAIDATDTFDADNSDKSAWQEVKSTPTAIGFSYSYGYEGTYLIAYSKKRGKAVVYYSSD